MLYIIFLPITVLACKLHVLYISGYRALNFGFANTFYLYTMSTHKEHGNINEPVRIYACRTNNQVVTYIYTYTYLLSYLDLFKRK